MVMHSAIFRFWQHSVGYILTGRLGKLNPSKINGQPSRRLQKGKQNLILPLEDGTNKIRFEETDK